MYTYCTIQWVDDDEVWEDQVIKAKDDFDPNDAHSLKYDPLIFFYGLSRDELLCACQHDTVIEGEWRVLEVGESFDRFADEE